MFEDVAADLHDWWRNERFRGWLGFRREDRESVDDAGRQCRTAQGSDTFTRADDDKLRLSLPAGRVGPNSTATSMLRSSSTSTATWLPAARLPGIRTKLQQHLRDRNRGDAGTGDHLHPRSAEPNQVVGQVPQSLERSSVASVTVDRDRNLFRDDGERTGR
jgi:hypothetical protein